MKRKAKSTHTPVTATTINIASGYTLAQLVPKIITAHALGEKAGIEHFRRVGEYLCAAKAKPKFGKHGQWLKWVEKNFGHLFSYASAARWMQLSRINPKQISHSAKSGLRATLAEHPKRKAPQSVQSNNHRAAGAYEVPVVAERLYAPIRAELPIAEKHGKAVQLLLKLKSRIQQAYELERHWEKRANGAA